jgi:hypothetical protein
VTDVQGLTRALTELKPSRRTVLVAAAWTAPAVMGLSAVPAVAASGGTFSSGDLVSATWTLPDGLSAEEEQLGKTGWTPPDSAHTGPTATRSAWLDDIKFAAAGFLSEQDAAVESEVVVTYTYQILEKDADVTFDSALHVYAHNTDNRQLLTVRVNDGRTVRLYAGQPTEPEGESVLVEGNEYFPVAGGESYVPFQVSGSLGTITVELRFVLPAGASGDFWVEQPSFGPHGEIHT